MAAVNNTSAALSQLQGIAGQIGSIASAAGINPATTGGGTTPAAGTTGVEANAAAAAGTAAATGTAAPMTIPGTGKAEVRNVGGVTKYFAAAPVGTPAKEITAYQYAEKNINFVVDLDYREGISAGLSNLGNIFSARQERIRLLSNALANDANNGTINAADMARLQAENSTTEQLSMMQKKIFDSVQNAIQAWLR